MMRQRLALYLLTMSEPALPHASYAPTEPLLTLDSPELDSALRISADLALDANAPARRRTEAVEALSEWREQAIAKEALLGLLEPAAWYFDPDAYPFPQSSAALVVKALKTDTSAVAQEALDRLGERTDEIPRGGEYVEWLLKE